MPGAARQRIAALHPQLAEIALTAIATLTIRQLGEKTKTRLRVRAAYHGRSMKEEARARFSLAYCRTSSRVVTNRGSVTRS
jgi:hypothetical protein